MKETRQAGDSVLVTGSWQASGEQSGIDVSSDWFTLWTLRDARIARVRFFSDRAEALAVAGLSD
jgi:ketosteroid isomerase-like protein